MNFDYPPWYNQDERKFSHPFASDYELIITSPIIGQTTIGFMSGFTDGLITHAVFALLPFSEMSGKPLSEKAITIVKKSIADGISQAIVEGTESSLNSLYYWRTRSAVPMSTTRLLSHSLSACVVSSLVTEMPDIYQCWKRKQLNLKVNASSVLVNSTMLFAGRSVPLLVQKFLDEHNESDETDEDGKNVQNGSSKATAKLICQSAVKERAAKVDAKERSWFITQLSNLMKKLK